MAKKQADGTEQRRAEQRASVEEHNLEYADELIQTIEGADLTCTGVRLVEGASSDTGIVVTFTEEEGEQIADLALSILQARGEVGR